MSDPTDVPHPEWKRVYDYMLERTSKISKDINTADLDWFLRDSNVSLLEQPKPQESLLPDNKRPASPNRRPLLVALHLQTPSSPQLVVLNTNKSNASKTKPSVASVSEEDVVPSPLQDLPAKPPASLFTRRRSSISSMGSASSIDSLQSSGGFFSKVKNKLQRINSAGLASGGPDLRPQLPLTPTASARPRKNSLPGLPPLTQPDFFKPDYSVSQNSQAPPRDRLTPAVRTDLLKPPPTIAEESPDDPRLEQYIRFFSQPDHKPSCLRHAPKDTAQHSTAHNDDDPPQHSRLTSFLRRMSTSQPLQALSPVEKHSFESATSPSPEPPVRSLLPTLQKAGPMKHVAFHSRTFLIDPPQQIPSRTPRKGNVEILPSGGVRINPLTELDKVAIEKSLRGQGGGLVVGGTGALGLINKDAAMATTPSEDSFQTKGTEDSESDVKIDEHAKSLGVEKPMLHHTNRVMYSVPVKKMALDLMYTRCCHLREILPIPAIAKQIPEGSTAPLPILQLRNPTPTMIEVQTFADFIRIAPIICVSLDGVSLSFEQFKILLSAMCLKTQLEKLSLRNTPISTEGWTLLAWFLSRNKVINRLDITQCSPLSVNVLKKKAKKKQGKEVIERMTCNRENRSDMDWTLLTAALIARGGIDELILTGCCITDLVTFECLMKRAVAIKTFKLGLAYNQLTPQQVKIVLESYIFRENSRGLDLGYNDLLSPKYLLMFIEYWHNHNCREKILKSKLGFLSLNATNLRFNDMFKEVFGNFITKLPELKYLDMSNNPRLFGNYVYSATSLDTNSQSASSSGSDENGLDNPAANAADSPSSEAAHDATVTSENGESLSDPAKSDEQVDLADTINQYFCSQLLLFKSLLRLHMDHNGLSSQSLTAFFETIPFCKTINTISIMGNDLDIYSATALVQCLRNSKSLITVDADFSNIPAPVREKIGLYSMRNMEQNIRLNLEGSDVAGDSNGKDESDHGTLTDELNHILALQAENKLDMSSPEVKHLVDRIKHYRHELKQATDDLFLSQYKRELNMEGKEALIRLLYVDASLERGLNLLGNTLVEQENGVTSSEIITMHLAEDEKSTQKNSSILKAQEPTGDQIHMVLSAEATTLPISRPQLFTNLANLDKEEGLTMKLLRMNNGIIFNELDSDSGEEIRQKLLNGSIARLDSVIDNICKARLKGIDLKEIFKEKFHGKQDSLLNDLRQQLENFKKEFACEKDPELKEVEDSIPEHNPKAAEDDSTVMEETYDRILNKFNK